MAESTYPAQVLAEINRWLRHEREAEERATVAPTPVNAPAEIDLEPERELSDDDPYAQLREGFSRAELF